MARGWRRPSRGLALLAAAICAAMPAEAARPERQPAARPVPASVAHAAPNTPAPDSDSHPRQACLAAARAAEREFQLPGGLLVAVALSESGLHSYALNVGGRSYTPASFGEAREMLRNAGGRSVMAGCVQVNAGAHARGQDWPLDPVAATRWAARIIRVGYRQSGGNWIQALRFWQSGHFGQGGTPTLCRIRSKLAVVAPDSAVLEELPGCRMVSAAHLRRDGRILLELAEAPER